jgi:hypothetical protein
MNASRRSFLAMLGLGPLAVAGAGTAGHRHRVYRLGRYPVAGFQYHEGVAIREKLRSGNQVSLVAEPQNPFDAQAVRIEFEGRQIGYLPQSQNTVIFNLLEQGAPIRGKIVEVDPDAEPWRALKIEAILSV